MMDSVTEHRSAVRIEFREMAPQEEEVELAHFGEKLLSPAKGLMLGIAIGLISWLIVGTLVYVLIIHP